MGEYLHPTYNDKTVVEIIKSKIITQTPFALTRFGDGEIYIINRNAKMNFLEKNLKEWGYKFPDQIKEFYDDANKVIINALVKSDFVGLMNKNCDIVNIGYDQKKWSLKVDLLNSFGIDSDSLKICNHMISRSKILGSVEGFKDVIQGKDFHIITTHKEIMKRKNLNKVFGVNVTYTEHSNNINFNNRDKFIKNFKNIEEDIVLMGVGLQKDYGIILRDEYGKIAIDMGATMDAWAGIKSRPWFNNNKQNYLVL